MDCNLSAYQWIIYLPLYFLIPFYCGNCIRGENNIMSFPHQIDTCTRNGESFRLYVQFQVNLLDYILFFLPIRKLIFLSHNPSLLDSPSLYRTKKEKHSPRLLSLFYYYYYYSFGSILKASCYSKLQGQNC